MAAIASPSNPLASTEVDIQHAALRASLRPVQALGWYSGAVKATGLTGVASVATLFSFRNTDPTNTIIVTNIGVGVIATTGFTAAQAVDVSLFSARLFTVSDTAGTAVSFASANNLKHRTSLQAPAVDMRITSTATPVSPGTRTVDTNALGMGAGWATTAAGVIIPYSNNNLFSADVNKYPIVLGPNEGFLILNGTTLGAGGLLSLYVGMTFAAVAAY